MKDIIMKILDELFEFILILFFVVPLLMFLLSLYGESRDDKKLKIYKECMEVKNANIQTCKELANVKSNNR